MISKFIVITSVSKITKGIKKFADLKDWHVILIGDKKTPPLKKHRNITYFSIEEQKNLGFRTYEITPFNHYARKNLGYLYAIKEGAKCIGDTDDDNIPYKYNNWGEELKRDSPIEIITKPKIVNIYQLFTERKVWPRGYPLDKISENPEVKLSNGRRQDVVIWQGLADCDPDVDAIYRLVFGKENNIKFDNRIPVALNTGVYCPFNSQNTIWFPEAFAYLYLPTCVTFRFTDILRGYIAQRGIHAFNKKLAFTNATVYQDRNIHNLISDFIDEVPCYTQTGKIIDVLEELKLNGNPLKDLHKMYQKLCEEGIVPEKELDGVEAWIKDISDLKS